MAMKLLYWMGPSQYYRFICYVALKLKLCVIIKAHLDDGKWKLFGYILYTRILM